MALAGENPVVVIGCLRSEVISAALRSPMSPTNQRSPVRLVQWNPQPAHLPAARSIDFGDTSKLTPLLKMYTLATISCPRGFTRRMRYHGASPLATICSRKASSKPKLQADSPFLSSMLFPRLREFCPHRNPRRIRGALMRRSMRVRPGVRACLSVSAATATSIFGLTINYRSGKLQDYEHPEEAITSAMQTLRKLANTYLSGPW